MNSPIAHGHPKARIYFDANAGIPLNLGGEVALGLFKKLEAQPILWGHPASVHVEGRSAQATLRHAKDNISKSLANLGFPKKDLLSNLELTCSGSSANFWVVHHCLQMGARKWAVSPVEHQSVLDLIPYFRAWGGEVRFLPVDVEGRPMPPSSPWTNKENVEADWVPDLISSIWINNETGVVTDIEPLVQWAISSRAFLHLDGAQAWGKITSHILNRDEYSSLNYAATFAGAKTGGPQGSGCVISSSALKGAGGASVAALSSIGTLEAFWLDLAVGRLPKPELFRAHTESLALRLREGIKHLSQTFKGLEILTFNGSKLDSTILLSIAGPYFYDSHVTSKDWVRMLDLKGVSVSVGAACNSGNEDYSHILKEIGVPEDKLKTTFRISFSIQNTLAEVEAFLLILKGLLQDLHKD